jgi:hypothetical protein
MMAGRAGPFPPGRVPKIRTIEDTMPTETLCETETATALEAREITSTSKRPRWRLETAPEGLRGECDDGASFEIPRSEFHRRAQLFDSALARRALVVRAPRRILQLEPPSFRELQAWIGKDLLVRMELRKRFGWVLVIGVILILGSLPFPADPAAGIPAAPLQPVGLALGAVLILESLLARLRPDRIYVLLDSGWFAVLAADTVLDVVLGASPYWALAITLQVWLAWTGFRTWLRLGKTE